MYLEIHARILTDNLCLYLGMFVTDNKNGSANYFNYCWSSTSLCNVMHKFKCGNEQLCATHLLSTQL